jgi:hypothetical protein
MASTRARSQVARGKRNLLSRIVEALHESRMRQAQREIARHRHLFHDESVTSPED